MTVPTVGVEEEYQLVEPESGSLASGADRVLRASWSEDLEGELQQTMLEIQTPPCRTAGEVADSLLRRRLTAAATAAAEGLEIVAAGTHPFSPWRDHRMAPGERAGMLERRFRRVARTEHIFGTHIHVEIPGGVDGARLMTRVRWLTPVLVALTASSPFFEGEDTGYASYRTVLQRRLPFTGPPPAFGSVEEHDALVDALIRTRQLPDRRTLYWNVRLHPELPTLEFRGPDACPVLDHVVAIACLARAAVVHCARGGSVLPTHDPTPGESERLYLESSEWQAARFGLDGTMVVPGSPAHSHGMRDEARRLLRLLAPVLEDLGDADALHALADVLEGGNAADRMRAVHAPGRDLVRVVDWLRAESQPGLATAIRSPAPDA